MGPLSQEAQLPYGWGPATQYAIDTVSSTGPIDLGAYCRSRVFLFWIPDSSGSGHSCHVRFGDSSVGAATLDDLPLTEQHALREVLVWGGYDHVRAIAAGGAGSLYIAPLVP